MISHSPPLFVACSPSPGRPAPSAARTPPPPRPRRDVLIWPPPPALRGRNRSAGRNPTRRPSPSESLLYSVPRTRAGEFWPIRPIVQPLAGTRGGSPEKPSWRRRDAAHYPAHRGTHERGRDIVKTSSRAQIAVRHGRSTLPCNTAVLSPRDGLPSSPEPPNGTTLWTVRIHPGTTSRPSSVASTLGIGAPPCTASPFGAPSTELN